MASGRIACDDDLLWIDSKLFERLSDDPAVHLETVTERYWKRVFRSKSVVYRKHNDVVFFHHVRPLSGIVGVLKAAHADEGSPVEMKDYFFDLVLEILLSS